MDAIIPTSQTRSKSAKPKISDAYAAKPADALAADPATGPAVQTGLVADYCFSIAVDVAQRLVGEIQGGFRVDLDYSATKTSVSRRYSTELSERASGHLDNASILSGSDWAFVSQDGVVDFDSRITLLLGPAPAARCLISGRIRGRASLRNARTSDGLSLFGEGVNRNDVLSAWKGGLGDGSYLPLVLGVAFDVPVEGFDDGQTAAYEDCRELGRSLLLGVGKATYGKELNSNVKLIELDLYRVQMDMHGGGSVAPKEGTT